MKFVVAAHAEYARSRSAVWATFNARKAAIVKEFGGGVLPASSAHADRLRLCDPARRVSASRLPGRVIDRTHLIVLDWANGAGTSSYSTKRAARSGGALRYSFRYPRRLGIRLAHLCSRWR